MQVELVVPGSSRLPGMPAELVVPDGFRFLVVLVNSRSPGIQAELVIPDGCRPLFILSVAGDRNPRKENSNYKHKHRQ